MWLIKVNSSGQKEWDVSFGGKGYNSGRAVELTIDNGYAIAGLMGSHEDGQKAWLVKLGPESD